MSLTDELVAVNKAEATKRKKDQVERREQSIKRLEAGFEYIFGEAADSVEPFGKEGAVVAKDGIRFVFSYGGASGSSGGMHVLCCCNKCGKDFVSYDSLGSIKNNYGGEGTPPEKRREYAIEQLAKLHARDYQPNGYGHDHVCYEGAVADVRRAILQAVNQTGLSSYDIVERAMG